ncbi:MAG: hypothetical protein A3A80_02040 [Candidatus Terrybacteria bacterium RIFCSPLOWO2_01_FULL_44_24]|uniref:DUF7282 domain-containing protein n=1 Tax=Candidatus Terrybacteria bacterium RIFCSPHIGHO2_01_FULL_43_35 TaxID=1802361 RepID=A0A1G2PEA8_9BACT|nr:MAG: hypothetical protein A2828_01830 [Candidatus Terrybacteria bacterium RIFCSPHIGHO2_01_FULL_43_35]OHA50861.1 MAG: hypothetical protein A3A80_02040 [Candidatus Terrybacteria bacterium RIFCSPLOWO2_01_FULL_44_24]
MKITVPFIIIAFVLGVMLGYYFGYDSGFERAANKNVLKNTDTNTGFRIGENAIYVSEQKPSDIVVVDFVDVSGGGFVVIHESVGETAGAIIGNSNMLAPGATEKIQITLTRPTQDGEELIAMLHNDNGDGVFHMADDHPLRDAAGNIMYTIFTISANAETPGVTRF